MGTVHNEDTLFLKYGRDEGSSLCQAGAYCGYDNSQYAEINIDLTDLTEVEQIVNDVFIVPDNCLLERVEVITLVPAVTGVAIDVGLIHTSRDTGDAEFTADPDGILAAFVTASMDTVGQTVRFFASGTADAEESLPSGVTTGGVLIGDVITANCYVTASRTTATAFTAGKIVLRLWYRPSALSGFDPA